MTELAGPLAIVAGVLAVGGAMKIADPAATQAMLGALGMPAAPWLARGLGLLELAAGLAAALLGGRVASAAVAGLYLVFAAVAWRLVRGGQASSCGCFGRLSAPATWIHVTADLAAAAVAVGAAVTAAPGLAGFGASGPLQQVTLLALVAIGTWLGVAILTVLPATLVAARRVPARAAVQEFRIGPPAAR
ncbi:MauE/DoxX family redox-associated membrane protein [Rhabdothermincola sp.]|uniref:MauE/DoxX family redox-associated membrane protein n=1 Tax=Rhabdothermincola sp. TaxID=2820405 RepID=UPI002FE20E5D